MVSPDQKLLREYIFQLQNSNPHLEVFHRTLKMLVQYIVTYTVYTRYGKSCMDFTYFRNEVYVWDPYTDLSKFWLDLAYVIAWPVGRRE